MITLLISLTLSSRLIAGTTIGERQNLNKGVINPFQGRIVARSPLICTNVAEGHTKVKLAHVWGLFLFPIKSRSKFHLDSFPW